MDASGLDAPRGIGVVFFDVGGTLVRPAAPLDVVLDEEARAVGVMLPPTSLSRLPTLVAAGLAARARTRRPFTYPAGASEAFWMGLYARALDATCPPELVDLIARRVYDRLASATAYTLYPDALLALRELASRGYVLGIVSNWERWLRDGLEAMGLGGLFTHVVISGEVELEKPDPRIFRRAVEMTGCQPDEIAYVGDDPIVDVEAADASGLVGVLVHRRSDSVRPAAPGRVVTTLAQLAPLFDGLSN